MMARSDPQINLRLPVDLKEKIRNSAEKNHRSVNAEIVHALEEYLKAKKD